MAVNERASVLMIRGDSESRLRQAMAQGLVSNDLKADVESVLQMAQKTNDYARSVEEQLKTERDTARMQSAEIRDLKRQFEETREYYAKADAVYRREKSRARDSSVRIETLVVAGIGAAAFVVANVIGKLIF